MAIEREQYALAFGHRERTAGTEALLDSKDLLAPWQHPLVGGQLHPSPSPVFHQFVGDVQTRCIPRDGHVSSHTEAIDRRASRQEPVDLIFIQIAAGENAHAKETG